MDSSGVDSEQGELRGKGEATNTAFLVCLL